MNRSTLLICCAAPLQSWGSRSRFTERDTEREPTKSGIAGLLAAALGRSREEPVDDLAALRMGVRADREGVSLRDFHTAQNVRRADNPRSVAETVLSNRYYLADATFLVGLEGRDDAFLTRLYVALGAPRWPLCLGRRACVPSLPIRIEDGLRLNTGLEEALADWPRLAEARKEDRSTPTRTVIECQPDEEGEPRMDVPLCFDSARRRFSLRRVRVGWLQSPETSQSKEVS